MVAVKLMAWVGDDGYPVAVPALSLQPAGENMLVCRRAGPALTWPPPDTRVSANILTFEAISYQVKGQWKENALCIQEIYAGGPPIPGGRIA
jgi:hypothetical protein